MKINKMNDQNMENDMRELTLEELEQVEGGGMKEILAAVTLAAMAATSPVAPGLAEDLAKDAEDSMQKLTDSYIAKIDELIKKKEADIMVV